MNDLITAAQQALEAMEEACEIIGAAWAWRDEKGKPTITALRAALAQQAEPVEPVAWVGDPSTQDYASTVPDPQVADHLARHGIPMP